MGNRKKEIDTIIFLLDISVISESKNYGKIKSELKEIQSDEKVKNITKKNLLKIVHSTRALDTTIRSYLDHHNIRGQAHSLGKYLYKLHSHNNQKIRTITEQQRAFYQEQIVNTRNKYMHSAGKIANDSGEVQLLITQTHKLLRLIIGL